MGCVLRSYAIQINTVCKITTILASMWQTFHATNVPLRNALPSSTRKCTTLDQTCTMPLILQSDLRLERVTMRARIEESISEMRPQCAESQIVLDLHGALSLMRASSDFAQLRSTSFSRLLFSLFNTSFLLMIILRLGEDTIYTGNSFVPKYIFSIGKQPY